MSMSEKVSGIVTNIQNFSLDDGPGIRTTVFLKGCPLHCKWCHNPECINFRPQLEFFAGKCVRCCSCVQVCSQEVHNLSEGIHTVNFANCNLCGKCIEVCAAGAVGISGKRYRPSELAERLVIDRDFYDTSGGGVTFSGGEPLAQIDFLEQVSVLLKARGIHIAVDTCGYVSTETMERALEIADLFLYDIKCLDAEKHKALTGKSNELILRNLSFLMERGIPVIIRMPLIRGINDDIGMLLRTAGMLKSGKNILKVELLKYHKYGISKYETIGEHYQGEQFQAPEEEDMKRYVQLFKDSGLDACFR